MFGIRRILRLAVLDLTLAFALPIVANAAGGILPPAQLQQMSSIIRFLRLKIDAEQPQASSKVKFTALLEAIELFGITVPNRERLEPTMTNSEMAIYILQGTLPVKRKTITTDVSRFLGGLPGAPQQMPKKQPAKPKVVKRKVVKRKPVVRKQPSTNLARAIKKAKTPKVATRKKTVAKKTVVAQKPPAVKIKEMKHLPSTLKGKYSMRERKAAANQLKDLLSSAVNNATKLDGAVRSVGRAE